MATQAAEARAYRVVDPPSYIRAADVPRGTAFKVLSDNEHVYAPVSHQGAPVTSDQHVWAVVIEVGHSPNHRVGEIVPVPDAEPVQILRQASPTQYLVV